MHINEKLDEFLVNENKAQVDRTAELYKVSDAVKMSGSIPTACQSYCVVEQTENFYIVKNGEIMEAIPIEDASIIAISVIR